MHDEDSEARKREKAQGTRAFRRMGKECQHSADEPACVASRCEKMPRAGVLPDRQTMAMPVSDKAAVGIPEPVVPRLLLNLFAT